MNIAVIGANGFIGSRLVEQLHLGTDHAVIPIVREPGNLARSARFEIGWRLADALDRDALRAALQGCDAVVHVARGKGREIERLPAVLCAAAAAVGIKRMVYLSSAAVHGPNPEPGTNEQTPLPSEHAIRETSYQAAAEKIFFRETKRLRLEGILLRPGIAYGPRSPWFSNLARELRDGRAWWFGEGRGIFNGIYVDNLASAIFSALSAPATACGKAYLVGDEETVTWREFYLAVASLTGASPRRIASVTEMPPLSSTADARLRRLAETPGLKVVVPVMPPGVKRLAKYLLSTPPASEDGWSQNSPLPPTITREQAWAQQCRWRFPHKRAARALGFHPPVTFSEALNRTVAWLAFANQETGSSGDPNSHRNLRGLSATTLADEETPVRTDG